MNFIRTLKWKWLLINFAASCYFALSLQAIEIKPTELTTPIQIPGVGYQTFDHTLVDDRIIGNSGLVSGSAYIRWTWKDFEPNEGQYEWKHIDTALARAWRSGQTLEFRLMFEWPGHDALPQWLIDKGGKVRSTSCEGNHISPDLEDPIIKSAHYKLIRELGKRYNGHPDLGSVDIGSVGLWGEWQEYCDIPLLPSVAEKKAIIDLYHEAFPNTPLVAQSTDGASLAYATAKKQSGWRGDCWGDYGTDIWHHHQQLYTPANTNNPEAWKYGPIAMEPCALMDAWDGNESTAILQDAKDWHTSLINNKTTVIPNNLLDAIKTLAQKLGYRLTLRKITYPDKVEVDNPFNVTMDFENLGIAPAYRDYRIAFRVKDSQGRIQSTVQTTSTVKGLLPGLKTLTVSCKLPANLAPANYKLETALILDKTTDHLTPIAIQGKTSDGWYPLGALSVNKFTGAVRNGNANFRGQGSYNFTATATPNGVQFNFGDKISTRSLEKIAIFSVSGAMITPISKFKTENENIGSTQGNFAHSLIWDRLDAQGHRAGKGIYILSFEHQGLIGNQVFYLAE